MDLPDGNDPDSGVPVGHLEQFLQEVGLIGCFRAVVQVDLLACTVEASGHAEEWRDADAAGDPHLPRVGEGEMGEGSVRPLQLGRPSRREVHQHLVWSPRAFTTSRNAASSGAGVIENGWASPPSSANRTNTN
jgi:hypothetical protein